MVIMVAWDLYMLVFRVAAVIGMLDERSQRYGHREDREHMALPQP